MRVVCSIATVNRAFGAQGRPLRSKAVRSRMSIIRKGGEAMLMLCTAKNPSGCMYKLKCNIEKVFSRMCGKGVATLRLKDPQVDLQICDADPEEVGRLLKAIKLANQGQSLLGLGVLSTSEPAKKKSISKPPISMKIESKTDYPKSGFPPSLQQLTIEGCQLRKFDPRIFRLQNLTSLSITDNKLKEIPDEVADLKCLTDLNLENNLLTKLPTKLCERNSKLCASLKVLIINRNQIRYLPENIGNLSKLISLHASRNRLQFLPYDIGRLNNLKFLFAKANKIRFIPVSVRKLSLVEIDLSYNQFVSLGIEAIVNRLTPVRTLQDLACEVILKEKLVFEEKYLPPQCRSLIGMARTCVFCPKIVFRSYVRMPMKFDLSIISETVMHCETARKSAVIDVYMCSKKCLNRYHLLSNITLPLPEGQI